MNWQDVGKQIVSFAPVLSAILTATGVGAPAAAAVAAVGTLISSTLGVPNTPANVAAAIQASPDNQVKIAQIEADHGENLARIAQIDTATRLNADVSVITAVNNTMQEEDKTRTFSWRDYYGYISGTAFAIVTLIISYLVCSAVYLGHPDYLAQIPSIVGAFTTLFAIPLAVLGVHSGIEAYHSGMADRGK